MNERDVRRLIGRLVHDLAQPCASATLALETATELARRQASADVVQRLEAAAEALDVLRAKLRQAADFARGTAEPNW